MACRGIRLLATASLGAAALVGCGNGDATGPNGNGSDDSFEWSGTIAQGDEIEIKGVQGSITATGTSGGQVEVRATKSGSQDDPAEVTIEVEVIKKLANDGPILLPLMEDLPPLARLPTNEELETARSLAGRSGFEIQTEVAPIQVVGSGANLNEATMNGLERMAKLAEMDIDEVKNRVTITGGIEIGRLPGMVHISMLTPLSRLEQIGIAHLVKEQYGL